MWELIPDDKPEAYRYETRRLRVPGGWVVRSYANTGSYSGGCSVHQLFVADAEHRWRLDDPSSTEPRPFDALAPEMPRRAS